MLHSKTKQSALDKKNNQLSIILENTSIYGYCIYHNHQYQMNQINYYRKPIYQPLLLAICRNLLFGVLITIWKYTSMLKLRNNNGAYKIIFWLIIWYICSPWNCHKLINYLSNIEFNSLAISKYAQNEFLFILQIII